MIEGIDIEELIKTLERIQREQNPEAYAKRDSHIEKLFQDGKYDGYLGMQDSYTRFDALIRVAEVVENNVLAKIFYDWYGSTDGDGHSDDKHIALDDLLNRCAHHFYDVMDDDDRKAMDKINKQETVTLYRGTHKDNPLRCSWTLSKVVAESFAYKLIRYGGRHPEDMIVIKTEMEAHNILLYLGGRNEEEVLVRTKQIKAYETIE